MTKNRTFGRLREWGLLGCVAAGLAPGAKGATVVAWGENNAGQATPPLTLTNVTGVVGGLHHAFALLQDGTVSYWGDTNCPPPPGLSNVVALAAGANHCLALKSDNTVVAWGDDSAGQAEVPPGLTNVVAIAAGFVHSLALKGDGTVLAWGGGMTNTSNFPDYGQSIVPVGLTNVVAIAAGFAHSVALTADGRVIAWGAGQVNDGVNWNYGQTLVPAGLHDVVSIAAGYWCTLALTAQGTVVVWGDNSYGQTNVPPGLTNVVALAGGDDHVVALETEGTVACWGYNYFGEAAPPANLTNAVEIGAFAATSYAVVNDGSPAFVRPPFTESAPADSDVTLRAAAIGQPPLSLQWVRNAVAIPGATNSILKLTNVPLSVSGSYQCMASNPLSSVTSAPGFLTVLRTTPYFDETSTSFGFSAPGFQLPVRGLSGHGELVISASTNCLNWYPILTNPPALGSTILLDPTATTAALRFYRAVEK